MDCLDINRTKSSVYKIYVLEIYFKTVASFSKFTKRKNKLAHLEYILYKGEKNEMSSTNT